ncbi:7885_t:CDS:2 [Paraglomus occultum]|uniref:7885_t:CDS:1 n=1 Tax=Paraglomus occultum TaxID=144539 RepID=A0A9N9AN22_9GLOM|nr:7885_t:CDS:2 [Paraglomus occultum]
MIKFGHFDVLCYRAVLPICNLFNKTNATQYRLEGFSVGDTQITNLGDALVAFFALVFTIYIILRTHIKYAAVGRLEMIVLFAVYILLLITQIVTTSGLLLKDVVVLKWFTAIQLGLISTLAWLLLMNAIVGFQTIEDGTVFSVGGILMGAMLIFVAVGYIAIDTAFNLTGAFATSSSELKNIPLFVLYLIWPLFAVVTYVVLETALVLTMLGERKPLLLLYASFLCFAIGQVFMFVISKYIMDGTSGKIDGSMFATLFVFLSIFLVFYYWSSITEDDYEDYEF